MDVATMVAINNLNMVTVMAVQAANNVITIVNGERMEEDMDGSMLDQYMGKDCTISQKNWITGFPIADKSNFQDFPNRKPYLIMGKDSAITKQHLIDCTDTVTIGELTSIGGYGTQILSHSTSLQHRTA